MKDKVNEALEVAESLLEQHSLYGWKVYWNEMRKCVAETNHEDKYIVFSKYFIMKASMDDMVGVTLHEIAHAILGHGYGHGDEFMELCKKISPNDKYAVPQAKFDISRYIFTCPRCGYSGSHNSSRDKMCGVCYEEGNGAVFIKSKNKIELSSW